MEYGQAGGAARREAEVSAARAAKHQAKLDAATRRSGRFGAGAAGEQAVADAIRPLVHEGWHILHDRVMPSGGNIDHILVGPAAVIVIDTKAWNGELSIRNGSLYNSGYNQSRVLNALALQRSAVADAVADIAGDDGPVDSAIVITTQPDFGPEWVSGAVVTGLGRLVDGIRYSTDWYSASQVEAMTRVILECFPEMGSETASEQQVRQGMLEVESETVNPLFERGNRFLYLKQWSNYGKRRAYLRDEDGEELGYKDLKAGSVHLDHGGDSIAEAVLTAATGTGIDMRPKDLPKVPIRVPGGRLLSLFGQLNTTAIVGSLWTGRGQRRLYGYLVNPNEGFFDLGYVDLSTGLVKPSSEGKLSKDRGPAQRYLALLRDRCPFNFEG